MIFTVITLFPEIIEAVTSVSILGRARRSGALQMRVINVRDYGEGSRRNTDDTPYGGGGGMVMKPGPLVAALEAAGPADRRLLLSPQGQRFDQPMARHLARLRRIHLVCGHYEGVDQRVADFVDQEVSIGDYILTGGDLGALVIINAVTRCLSGVLGCQTSALEESFSEALLEHPQYTRPPSFRGREVPEILLSGDHGRIRRWRRRQALERTRRHRPDLFLSLELSPEDMSLLADAQDEQGYSHGP